MECADTTPESYVDRRCPWANGALWTWDITAAQSERHVVTSFVAQQASENDTRVTTPISPAAQRSAA